MRRSAFSWTGAAQKHLQLCCQNLRAQPVSDSSPAAVDLACMDLSAQQCQMIDRRCDKSESSQPKTCGSWQRHKETFTERSVCNLTVKLTSRSSSSCPLHLTTSASALTHGLPAAHAVSQQAGLISASAPFAVLLHTSSAGPPFCLLVQPRLAVQTACSLAPLTGNSARIGKPGGPVEHRSLFTPAHASEPSDGQQAGCTTASPISRLTKLGAATHHVSSVTACGREARPHLYWQQLTQGLNWGWLDSETACTAAGMAGTGQLSTQPCVKAPRDLP